MHLAPRTEADVCVDYFMCLPECEVEPTGTVSTTTTSTPNAERRTLQRRAAGSPIVALDGWAAGSYLRKSYSGDDAILDDSWFQGRFLTGPGRS
ncbi:hypothetical protein FRC11_004950, partial [Ceratobasidium sp. 423]